MTILTTIAPYIDKETIQEIPNFPIHGDILTRKDLNTLYLICKGRPKYGDCIFAAAVTQKHLTGKVVLGSCFIYSKNYKSNYGFAYNPPIEFHAWVQLKENIIDITLPFLIEKGLNTKDEYGSFITGRKPFILAGIAPKWVKYKAKTVLYYQ